MTSALKMLVQKGIIIFGLSDSTIVLTKSFLQSSTSSSNILHPTISALHVGILLQSKDNEIATRFVVLDDLKTCLIETYVPNVTRKQ